MEVGGGGGQNENNKTKQKPSAFRRTYGERTHRRREIQRIRGSSCVTGSIGLLFSISLVFLMFIPWSVMITAK